MKLICFSPSIDEGNRLLNNLIDHFTAVRCLEIYRTIDALSKRLREPKKNGSILVLFATSKRLLLEIIAITTLLQDIKIVLVLPDRKDDTIAKGHMLRPRFVTYADTDCTELYSVVHRMAGIREDTGVVGMNKHPGPFRHARKRDQT